MMLSAPVGVVTREAVLQPTLSLLNNRQYRYEYRLLVASVTQHARDILHASLREGKGQAKPGKQPENDNEWTRSRERKGKTLRQRLARAVIESKAIIVNIGAESTEWMKREGFPGKVSALTQNTKAAPEEADVYRDETGEVSFWTDGSRLDSRRAGAGAALRHQ